MALPVANFNADLLVWECPILVTFTSEGSWILTRWRDFGDGYFSKLENPVHTYYKAWAYTVSLLVTNKDWKDTLTINDYLNFVETTSGQTNKAYEVEGRNGVKSFPPYATNEFASPDDERTIIPGENNK